MPPRPYPADLARQAASALAVAAATDAWDEIRRKVTLLFGRGEHDARIRQLLKVLAHAASNKSTFEHLDLWTAEFANLLAKHPDAEPELAALVHEMSALPPPAIVNDVDRSAPGDGSAPEDSPPPSPPRVDGHTEPAMASSGPGPFEPEPFEAVLPEFDDDKRQTGDEPHEHHRAHLGATAIRTGFHPPVPEGVYCWKGHLIDLEALFCPICGVSMNQRTLEPVPAIGSPYVPDQDALSRAVRAAVKPGILAFNPPAEMTQRRKERIEVRIARSPELRAALVKGLQGAVQFEEVPTADYRASSSPVIPLRSSRSARWNR